MFETKMTEMLGIKYPIQCGTMHGLTTAEVVAPFANAGCLCCLPSAYYDTKEELLTEVGKVRDQTDQPFGINVGLFPEMRVTVTAEERIDWVIESGVKILRGPEAIEPEEAEVKAPPPAPPAPTPPEPLPPPPPPSPVVLPEPAAPPTEPPVAWPGDPASPPSPPTTLSPAPPPPPAVSSVSPPAPPEPPATVSPPPAPPPPPPP